MTSNYNFTSKTVSDVIQSGIGSGFPFTKLTYLGNRETDCDVGVILEIPDTNDTLVPSS